MPTYEYQCKSCNHRFEVWQKMADDPLTVCPECNGTIRRLLFPAGIVFKGSGFYKTDHGSGPPAVDKSESSSADDKDKKKGTEEKAKTEGTGESKSGEDKTAAKVTPSADSNGKVATAAD